MAYRTEHVWERLNDEEYLERNIGFCMNSRNISWIIGKFLILVSGGRTDCNLVPVTGQGIYSISFFEFMGKL